MNYSGELKPFSFFILRFGLKFSFFCIFAYIDYSLHGISPFYDQTIFVRCHLCRNIVKLPQLADHLGLFFC